MNSPDDIRQVWSQLRAMNEMSEDERANIRQSDPIAYMQRYSVQVMPTAQRIYEGLPKELRDQAWKKFLGYFVGQATRERAIEFTSPDERNIEYLRRFISLQSCEGGVSTDYSALEEALRAVAQELRDYYGREDDDEEVPCW